MTKQATKFKVERFGIVQQFDTRDEALRFIMRRADYNELWSWVS